MNITNAKQVYYHNKDWECSNVIGDEFIACSHGNPNTHEKTLLYKVNLTTKVRVPLLHKWCTDNKSGLEDAYWLKNVNGYDWLGAERKVWGGDQANISVFRAKTGTNDYKWLFDICPTSNSWEDYSVSSPTMRYSNGVIKVVYEGRFKNKQYDVNYYKTGYLEISPILLKVIYREKNPILSDRLVPDDFTGTKLSGHRQGTGTVWDKDDIWHAVVYKLVGNKWVQDFEPKYKGIGVGEYYFNKYFWYNNDKGLWRISTEPNGDNMKPTTPTGLKLTGNTLSWNKNPELEDIEHYHVYNDDLPDGDYEGSRSGSSNTLVVENTKRYYVLAENSEGRSNPSEWVGVAEPEVIKGCMDSNALNYNPLATEDDGSCEYETTDNDEVVGQLKTDIIDMQNILSKMYADLDKIK